MAVFRDPLFQSPQSLLLKEHSHSGSQGLYAALPGLPAGFLKTILVTPPQSFPNQHCSFLWLLATWRGRQPSTAGLMRDEAWLRFQPRSRNHPLCPAPHSPAVLLPAALKGKQTWSPTTFKCRKLRQPINKYPKLFFLVCQRKIAEAFYQVP